MKSNLAKSRALRPREQHVIEPVSISNLTCEACTGMNPRRWVEFVRSRNIPHTRVGQLTIVTTRDWLAALVTSEPSESAAEVGSAPAGDADALLASLGFRVAGGAR